jgi:phosphohistidine phosphatase
MKTLLILRHAKAQQDVPDGGDWARALTARGRGDAETMGAHIRGLIGIPDAIVTSGAVRARQTAEIVAGAVGFSGDLTVEPDAYAADPSTLLALVRGIPDEVDTAVLVGHNPGLEELAAALASDDVRAIRLPTAGLAHLEFDAPRWSDVAEGTGRWRGVATRRTVV